MKSLLLSLILLGSAILLLRTDYLPWKIVSRVELTQLTKAKAQAVMAARPRPTPQATLSSGDWMRDPNRKNKLDPSVPKP